MPNETSTRQFIVATGRGDFVTAFSRETLQRGPAKEALRLTLWSAQRLARYMMADADAKQWDFYAVDAALEASNV